MSGNGIFIDLSAFIDALDNVGASLPEIAREAVGAVAQRGQEQWQALVWEARLWEGEKRPYFESIQWRFTGPYSAEIYTDYELAEEIEAGRPSHDLKEMLARSPKTRISQKGLRYLAIPFRHNVSALQAAGVYDAARKLAPSSVTGQGQRLSQVKPTMVPQRSYAWGGKLKAAGRINGLYRFDTSTGKGKSSTYLTFRTMSEGSSGWVIPARPGLNLARRAEEQLQREAVDIVKEKFS